MARIQKMSIRRNFFNVDSALDYITSFGVKKSSVLKIPIGQTKTFKTKFFDISIYKGIKSITSNLTRNKK